MEDRISKIAQELARLAKDLMSSHDMFNINGDTEIVVDTWEVEMFLEKLGVLLDNRRKDITTEGIWEIAVKYNSKDSVFSERAVVTAIKNERMVEGVRIEGSRILIQFRFPVADIR